MTGPSCTEYVFIELSWLCHLLLFLLLRACLMLSVLFISSYKDRHSRIFYRVYFINSEKIFKKFELYNLSKNPDCLWKPVYKILKEFFCYSIKCHYFCMINFYVAILWKWKYIRKGKTYLLYYVLSYWYWIVSFTIL